MSEHEMKMLGLQHQIRENQTDLQDFLKDMNSWEKDIRTKDERLKKDKADIKNVCVSIGNNLCLDFGNTKILHFSIDHTYIPFAHKILR